MPMPKAPNSRPAFAATTTQPFFPQNATYLLTAKQVAARLGCSTRQVIRLCERGELPKPIYLGTMRRWSNPIIEWWIDAGCPPCP